MTNRDLAINKKVFKKRKGIRARCKKKVSSTHFRSDVTSQNAPIKQFTRELRRKITLFPGRSVPRNARDGIFFYDFAVGIFLPSLDSSIDHESSS